MNFRLIYFLVVVLVLSCGNSFAQKFQNLDSLSAEEKEWVEFMEEVNSSYASFSNGYIKSLNSDIWHVYMTSDVGNDRPSISKSNHAFLFDAQGFHHFKVSYEMGKNYCVVNFQRVTNFSSMTYRIKIMKDRVESNSLPTSMNLTYELDSTFVWLQDDRSLGDYSCFSLDTLCGSNYFYSFEDTCYFNTRGEVITSDQILIRNKVIHPDLWDKRILYLNGTRIMCVNIENVGKYNSQYSDKCGRIISSTKSPVNDINFRTSRGVCLGMKFTDVVSLYHSGYSYKRIGKSKEIVTYQFNNILGYKVNFYKMRIVFYFESGALEAMEFICNENRYITNSQRFCFFKRDLTWRTNRFCKSPYSIGLVVPKIVPNCDENK